MPSCEFDVGRVTKIVNVLDHLGAGQLGSGQPPDVAVEVVRLDDVDPVFPDIGGKAQHDRRRMQAFYPVTLVRVFEEPHAGSAEAGFDFAAE